jgi:hypothetical protein
MKKLVAFAFLLLIGCEDSMNTIQSPEELKKPPESVSKAWVGKEFKLKVGEEVILLKENLRIKFISVPEDSRCPLNVDCFWSGNAKIVLEYRKDSNPSVPDTLNTHIQPHKSKYLNYIIILKNLEPYPVEPEQIPQEEYTATILVKKIKDKMKPVTDKQWF